MLLQPFRDRAHQSWHFAATKESRDGLRWPARWRRHPRVNAL